MTPHLTQEQRIGKSEQLAKDSYFKNSVISQIVNVRDFRPGDQGFVRIYKRVYVPREWFTRTDIYSDLAFEQLGSSIALSEKKFIIEDQILKNAEITRRTVDEINLSNLEETADSLVEAGFEPTVLVAPIEYFMPIYVDWQRSALRVGFAPDIITISRRNYNIFWSNKYIPIKEFIFIDKSFGEWISKPSFNERFYVRISPSDQLDKLDFLAYTTLKFSVVEPRKIAILQKNETTE
jgi:hypothetical protein